MVYQFKSDIGDWEKVDSLYYPKNADEIKKKITLIRELAFNQNVRVLIFPELSIPRECVEDLIRWSMGKEMIIVAGSHYDESEGSIISKCPVIYQGDVFYTEKVNPAPDELGGSKPLTNGKNVYVFKNSIIGNFVILICSDYLNDETKDAIKEEDLDFWIVPAFQKHSEWYYRRMSVNVEDTRKSRYIIYSNTNVENYSDGGSAFFGTLHKKYMDENGGSVDGQKWNQASLNEKEDYFIIDADINFKRPNSPNFPSDQPNIRVIYKGSLRSNLGDNPQKTAKLKSLSESLDDTAILSRIHQFIKRNYLKKGLLFESYNADNIPIIYDGFFESISDVKLGGDRLDRELGLLKSISKYFHQLGEQCSLLIKGPAGRGKTDFLSVLYYYLFSLHQKDPAMRLPIYINLDYYNTLSFKSTSKNISESAKERLKQDLADIKLYTKNNPEKELIIIIDGTEDYNVLKIDFDQFIQHEFQMFNIKGKIIGVTTRIDEHNHAELRYSTFPFIDNPEIEIEFQNVKVGSIKYNIFLNNYARVRLYSTSENRDALVKFMDARIRKYGLDVVDNFVISLLKECHDYPLRYQNARSLGDLYRAYLSHLGFDLAKCVNLAFKVFNNPIDVSEKEKSTKEWRSILKHPTIVEYLVAQHIISEILNYDTSGPNKNEFVYPHSLNAFCKDIINQSISFQDKVFAAIQKMFNVVGIFAKTHLVYLLGRFEHDSVKERAKKMLMKVKQETEDEIKKTLPFDSTKKLEDEEKRLLLFLRTIYISLTYLGNTKSSGEYIAQLIANKYFDSLNRGFHLEYYGDIPFSPNAPDRLNHEDNLGDFSKTFDRLSGKLWHAITSRHIHYMFQIELYTLCSLAQHRAVHGRLTAELRSNTRNLIEKSLEKKRQDLDSRFIMYLENVLIAFREPPKFKTGTFARELFKLKEIRRKGWVVRNINRPESIADHTLGSILLALLYLPYHLDEEPTYNKTKIMKMLLIHDLAEVSIGDLLPNEKNDHTKKLEEKYFEYLSIIGTFDGVADCSDFVPLMNEFNHSTDINSRVAREIDKLENLMQLHIYAENELIEDFEDFKNNLVRSIHTDVGKKIMSTIIDFYED